MFRVYCIGFGHDKGSDRQEAGQLYEQMKNWISAVDNSEIVEPAESLCALAAVRNYPARRRCVLLAWEALSQVLAAQ